MWSASRDLIHAVIRDRLRAEPKVSFLYDHEVVSLEPGGQDDVVGVWARHRDRRAPHGWSDRCLIPADFVVDASGRDSRTPQWLAELGYRPPTESVAAAGTACASAVFAPPLGHVADWTALALIGRSRKLAPGNTPPHRGQPLVCDPVHG